MTPAYLAHLQKTLADIEGAGLFKRERIITTPQSAHITVAGGRQVLNFCANNYLGLADNPEIIRACVDLAKEFDVPLHIHISETAFEVENMRKEQGMPVIPYVKKQGLFEAKVIAEKMENKIHDQLTEGGFYQALADAMTADQIIQKVMQHLPAGEKPLETHVRADARS